MPSSAHKCIHGWKQCSTVLCPGHSQTEARCAKSHQTGNKFDILSRPLTEIVRLKVTRLWAANVDTGGQRQTYRQTDRQTYKLRECFILLNKTHQTYMLHFRISKN